MDVATVSTGATSILDKIPVVISTIRDAVSNFLPSGYYPLIIAILAVAAAFYWVKQFVATGLLKVSVLLNIVLLALLIYIVMVYV